MNTFEQFSEELNHLVPFRIRFKDESWEMQVLNLLVMWFCPEFLTRFTTVVGSTIYFPSRLYVKHHPRSAIRTLAHEAVHLLDAQRWGFGTLALGYLFPQVLGAGVLFFPWIGPYALIFLVFLAPWPAPFRFYFEARAYAMDYLTSDPYFREATLQGIARHFESWDYYRMFPFPDQVEEQVRHWAERAEGGEDKNLLRVLLIYEMATSR